MQTTNEISTQQHLELPLLENGDFDIVQCAKKGIDVFWERKLTHVKDSLDWQEKQNARLAAHGGFRRPANRYLDNSEYFRKAALRIEDGYSSWICGTLNGKQDLAMDMNLYLNNKCPDSLVKANPDLPDGLLKFLMMMIAKIASFRAVFREYAPEVEDSYAGQHARQRKYDFSSALFYNVIDLLTSLWNENVQVRMEASLASAQPEQVVAVLEETVLAYDETRSLAGRIRLLEKIAAAASLPRFEEVKKPGTLFKAFAFDQLQNLKSNLSADEYGTAADGLQQQFGEIWNRLAAQKPGDSQTALAFDDMMVEIQKSLITEELREAFFRKNTNSGEVRRELVKGIQEATQFLQDVTADKNTKPEDVKKAQEELEEAKRAMANLNISTVSLDQTDESGRSLGETLAIPDENDELDTPEDYTQELWDGLNNWEKAYLILVAFFADNANGKDGLHQAFTEVTGCRDVRNVVVKNIIRQCVEKLADVKLNPFNAKNYNAIGLQMTKLVKRLGIQHDLTVTLGVLISQCFALHEADGKDFQKKERIDEINIIVKEVIKAKQRRK